MAGRRPTPSHLKLVRGNPGKRATNGSEPKPRREIPSPPAHLSDRAKVAWGAVSVLLDRMGILTEADGLALERLCEVYAEILEIRGSMPADGSRTYECKTKEGGTMIRAIPEVAMLADADRRFKAWLVEFGLTPAARTKVQVKDGQESDPLADYFTA